MPRKMPIKREMSQEERDWYWLNGWSTKEKFPDIRRLVDNLVNLAGFDREYAEEYVHSAKEPSLVHEAATGDIGSFWFLVKAIGTSLGIWEYMDASTMGDIMSVSRARRKKNSLVETVVYKKGHKNSKGEEAPWTIVSHKTGKILSSHSSKDKAEEHLQQIRYFKHKKSKVESVADFEKYLDGIRNRMGAAIRTAYGSLFESVKPGPAARKIITELVPAPPEGWDAPAYNNDGEELYSERTHTRFNWLDALESGILNEFFHSNAINRKFEPGVARIALSELGFWPMVLEDWRSPGDRKLYDSAAGRDFKNILKEISSPTHRAEFTPYLNDSTYDELHRLFRSKVVDDSVQTAPVPTEANPDYTVVHIPSFQEATRYSGDVDWCICHQSGYWRQYSDSGRRKGYFLIHKDYKNIPREPGEGCPKDAYGKSMIGLFVNDDGSIDTCCCRWNHAYGGDDHAFNKAELSELLGRDFSEACPPFREGEERSLPTSAPDIKTLGKKLARYQVRGIPLDSIDRYIQQEVDCDVELEALDHGFYKLAIGEQLTIINENYRPLVDYFEEFSQPDDDLYLLTSSYQWNEEYGNHDDNSVFLLYKNGNVIDVASDYSLYDLSPGITRINDNGIYLIYTGDSDDCSVVMRATDGEMLIQAYDIECLTDDLIVCNTNTTDNEFNEYETYYNFGIYKVEQDSVSAIIGLDEEDRYETMNNFISRMSGKNKYGDDDGVAAVTLDKKCYIVKGSGELVPVPKVKEIESSDNTESFLGTLKNGSKVLISWNGKRMLEDDENDTFEKHMHRGNTTISYGKTGAYLYYKGKRICGPEKSIRFVQYDVDDVVLISGETQSRIVGINPDGSLYMFFAEPFISGGIATGSISTDDKYPSWVMRRREDGKYDVVNRDMEQLVAPFDDYSGDTIIRGKCRNIIDTKTGREKLPEDAAEMDPILPEYDSDTKTFDMSSAYNHTIYDVAKTPAGKYYAYYDRYGYVGPFDAMYVEYQSGNGHELYGVRDGKHYHIGIPHGDHGFLGHMAAEEVKFADPRLVPKLPTAAEGA